MVREEIMKYNATITSIGSYVPESVLTNEYLEKNYDTTKEWIDNKIGADNRHIAAPGEAASDLAYKAASKCLEKTDGKIDCIIVSTTSPDYKWISTASIVANRLGLKNIPAFDVREGCSGCLHALDNAFALIEAGTYKRILVIASEVLSRFMDYTDRTMPAFFGDGAGAVIVERCDNHRQGFEYSYLDCDDSIYNSLIIKTGASSQYYRKDNYLNGDIYWYMNGKDIFNYAVKSFKKLVEKISDDTNILLSDIDKFIVHQANRNIIEENFKIHSISVEKTNFTIQKFGNTGSSSVFLCLDEAVKRNFIVSGDRVALFSFGAGGNFGVIVLVWDGKGGCS